MEQDVNKAPRLPLAVAGIMLLAFVLRACTAHFGLPALNDPDELMFQMGAVRLVSQQTLNPGWFGHPATTTIYLLAVIDVLVFATGWAVGLFASPADFADRIYSDPSWVILPGRLAMVLFGVACVWLTWRLASELFSRRVGIVAAALMAVNPLHITYSQIIRSDIMATAFMLLAMLAALRIARGGGRADWVKAALWLALAIITKWPFAIGGLAVLGAALVQAQGPDRDWRGQVARLVAFAPLVAVFAVLLSPYMVLDSETLLRNLRGEARAYHLGATGGTPMENLWWYLTVPILGSFGTAAGLAIGGGLVMMARRREAALVVFPVLIAFLAVISAQTLIWERWALPLLPLLAIAGGLMTVHLIDFLTRYWPRSLAQGAAGLLVLALVVPALLRFSGDARERTNDTRQLASQWVAGRIAPGSTVIVEHFGFDLLAQPWRFVFPLGKVGCVDARLMISGKAQYTAIDSGRGDRSNVDYGTLDPARADTCQADWAILTQYDRYAAERDRFPREYASYARLLAQGEIVATIAPEPGRIGGPIVRIIKLNR